MKAITRCLLFWFFSVCLLTSVHAEDGPADTSVRPEAVVRRTGLDDVRWTEGFWAERFNQSRDVSLPSMWDTLKNPDVSHAFTNFRIAAGLEEGEFTGSWWQDGDLYKWLEAVSYVYAITGEPELKKHMKRVIPVIKKAQAEDGYIHTPVLIGEGSFGNQNIGDTGRFEHLVQHELYNMGHLITAACAHHRATGRENFLKIAIKTAEYLHAVFTNPTKHTVHFPFNPTIIMASVELYRLTGKRKYLELGEAFVNHRGKVDGEIFSDQEYYARGGTDYNQDRTPLREEDEAEGHAVMANYLYAGATDVFLETGDPKLWNALDRLWRNVVYEKMYITGATGALHPGGLSSSRDKVTEAYGRSYQLPAMAAHNETCANISNGMWNWRLYLATGKAKYVDVLERVLYNSVLSGISLDGKRYCYNNPLRRVKNNPFSWPGYGKRTKYLTSFCCPPNVLRTIAKTSSWAYSLSSNTIWVNLYGSNRLKTELPGGKQIQIRQKTNYPWGDKIHLTIKKAPSHPVTIRPRIPGWANRVELRVNGERLGKGTPGTYAEVNREWTNGDQLTIHLPMKVKLMEAHPRVETARNQVAVQRGPIVYCMESGDLPEGIRVSEITLPEDIEFESAYREDLLGGVTVLNGEALAVERGNWDERLYRELKSEPRKRTRIRLIPYYAWNNRGIGEMSVWFPLDRTGD